MLELAGLGALPYGTLKLADMGADVIRVNRVSDAPAEPPRDTRPRRQFWREFDRGRRSIAVDLKSPAVSTSCCALPRSRTCCWRLSAPASPSGWASVRTGMARNPKLVYGRLTGWGQSGPLAQVAGHSLNYESLSGAIGSIGPVGGPPVPLLQVFGDFAGGGLHLAYGVVCALLEAWRTGKGQVVDAAMLDGVMSLYGVFYGMSASGCTPRRSAATCSTAGRRSTTSTRRRTPIRDRRTYRAALLPPAPRRAADPGRRASAQYDRSQLARGARPDRGSLQDADPR